MTHLHKYGLKLVQGEGRDESGVPIHLCVLLRHYTYLSKYITTLLRVHIVK